MYFELQISGIIIVLVIYLCMTLFLIYGKNIKMPKGWIFSKGRKKGFIIADTAFLIIYLLIIIFQFDYFIESDDNGHFLLFLFSFLGLQTLLHIVEEYLMNKEGKGYYHIGVNFIFLTGLVGIILWTK